MAEDPNVLDSKPKKDSSTGPSTPVSSAPKTPKVDSVAEAAKGDPTKVNPPTHTREDMITTPPEKRKIFKDENERSQAEEYYNQKIEEANAIRDKKAANLFGFDENNPPVKTGKKSKTPSSRGVGDWDEYDFSDNKKTQQIFKILKENAANVKNMSSANVAVLDKAISKLPPEDAKKIEQYYKYLASGYNVKPKADKKRDTSTLTVDDFAQKKAKTMFKSLEGKSYNDLIKFKNSLDSEDLTPRDKFLLDRYAGNKIRETRATQDKNYKALYDWTNSDTAKDVPGFSEFVIKEMDNAESSAMENPQQFLASVYEKYKDQQFDKNAKQYEEYAGAQPQFDQEAYETSIAPTRRSSQYDVQQMLKNSRTLPQDFKNMVQADLDRRQGQVSDPKAYIEYMFDKYQKQNKPSAFQKFLEALYNGI